MSRILSTKIHLCKSMDELQGLRKEIIKVSGADMDIFNSLRDCYIKTEYRLTAGFRSEYNPHVFTEELSRLGVDVKSVWT